MRYRLLQKFSQIHSLSCRLCSESLLLSIAVFCNRAERITLSATHNTLLYRYDITSTLWTLCQYMVTLCILWAVVQVKSTSLSSCWIELKLCSCWTLFKLTSCVLCFSCFLLLLRTSVNTTSMCTHTSKYLVYLFVWRCNLVCKHLLCTSAWIKSMFFMPGLLTSKLVLEHAI